MKTAFETFERLGSGIQVAYQYASLLFAEDTASEVAKKLLSRLEDMDSDISNTIVFFRLELAQMSVDHLKTLESDPQLVGYRYVLEQARKTAQYNLSEPEEQLDTLKDLAGVTVLRKLYEELTSGFQFEFELDGKIQKMNGSQLRALRQHADPDVRRRAMTLFFERYEANQTTFTHLYNGVVKNGAVERKVRGYGSPIQPMNIHNDLPDEVIQTLHDVTTESYPLVERYYRLKKKLINLPDLTLADIYAPLPQSNRRYTFEEAKEIVLKAFASFDKTFYECAARMFDRNRIDAPVMPTKRGGAFCSSSIPSKDPYVLLNFLGRDRDVATMAHELGHAIHDMLCSERTFLTYHPRLPLAETASVFSEMIVTDWELKKDSDRLSQISILTSKLEDIFATSQRQNMFSRFEMRAHERISVQFTSTDELCGMYTEELKRMFGDSVTVLPEYKWEWSAIPHLYEAPFYVYAYNFGNLLVIALYQLYLEEGPSFVPRLKRFLAGGSSASPQDLTRALGVDISRGDFWRKSMAYISGLVDRLETLV